MLQYEYKRNTITYLIVIFLCFIVYILYICIWKGRSYYEQKRRKERLWYYCYGNRSGCIDTNVCMKTDISIIIVVAILYLINQSVKNSIDIAIVGTFFRCYYNDLICGIAFPAYCNLLLGIKNKSLNKLWKIVLLLLICGIVWETVPVILFDHGVSDIFDIFYYIAGGMLYYINRKFQKYI